MTIARGDERVRGGGGDDYDCGGGGRGVQEGGCHGYHGECAKGVKKKKEKGNCQSHAAAGRTQRRAIPQGTKLCVSLSISPLYRSPSSLRLFSFSCSFLSLTLFLCASFSSSLSLSLYVILSFSHSLFSLYPSITLFSLPLAYRYTDLSFLPRFVSLILSLSLFHFALKVAPPRRNSSRTRIIMPSAAVE